MSCRSKALLFLTVLLSSFVSLQPCHAAPQSPNSTPGEPHSNSMTKEPSTGNVVAPNGGPTTGDKTGLAVGIALGVVLMGILLWLLIQCVPWKQRRNKLGPKELENNQKPVELEGDAPAEWLAELCGRHTPVPIECPKDEKRPPMTEAPESRPPTAMSRQASQQPTPEPGRLFRVSSIRLGESAMTPEASITQFRIPTPTAPSDVADPELRYLRREMAFVQEQRTRLERLEQLDALRRREEEIQNAIEKIEGVAK